MTNIDLIYTPSLEASLFQTRNALCSTIKIVNNGSQNAVKYAYDYLNNGDAV